MLLHRKEVQQRLRGMRVPAVARVQHMPFDVPRDQVRRARLAGAYGEYGRAERLKRAYRINQRLALGDAAGRCRDARDTCAQPLTRQLEGDARARAILDRKSTRLN